MPVTAAYTVPFDFPIDDETDDESSPPPLTRRPDRKNALQRTYGGVYSLRDLKGPFMPVRSPSGPCDMSGMDSSSQPPVKRGEVSKITDRILITDVWNAFDPEIIRNHRVTHVLSVMRHDDVPALARAQLDSVSSSDEGFTELTRLTIPIADSQNTSLLDVLPQALAFMDDALKENTENILLVHCYAGISRSPSCVIAHLMDAMDISMLAGYKRVREARPCIRPNKNFLGQLREWGKSRQDRRNASLASALPFSPSDDSGTSIL